LITSSIHKKSTPNWNPTHSTLNFSKSLKPPIQRFLVQPFIVIQVHITHYISKYIYRTTFHDPETSWSPKSQNNPRNISPRVLHHTSLSGSSSPLGDSKQKPKNSQKIAWVAWRLWRPTKRFLKNFQKSKNY